ncbi:hypothetical protein K0U91_01095 [Chryseobacterium chendengshani]|uniref:DUF6520 family protein n=1 Tax=Chryseobacterium sp. LJ668 TaxID=2864040 RepID=UPI001C68DF5D|nr:DUF6520 family protein [Chryseobacterium sp. LJ668]MBW8523820.1 hypothetical protein [Chryseobacterium sp. LJ668]QYK16763.1 hypothetical protein K0U91_01095 [Chryseobacterium sp. LJ668]
MRKFIFPVVLVLMGTGSAFATKVVKESKQAIESGYRLVNHGEGQFECINTGKDCSTVAGGPVCTWSVDNTVQLRAAASETMCGELLYEIQP